MLTEITYRRAEVTIALNNAGPDGYKSEIYGDLIYVRRTFDKKGLSTYATADAKKKNVMKTKSEVQAIAEHFNIQVRDNVDDIDTYG